MMRALFTAASGMIVQERRQANVSNNLANAKTTGFKIQDLIAKEKDKSNIQNRERLENGNTYMRQIGTLSLGAEVDDLTIDFEQGVLQESSNDLDFALEGDGFFKVKWDEFQTGYTRNGEFKLDNEGYLATKDGKRVLGKNNTPILVEDKKVTVTEDGRILLDGEESYEFEIVNLSDISNFNVIGSGIYLIDNAQEVISDDTLVYQNRIETSNVNPLEEMVKMIEISRTFESNQKVIQSIDEMMGKSNEIGKIR